jgi:23S rRNA pseudouridine2605 synthase
MPRQYDTTKPAGEKLQKVLAACGIASRRACEEMIRAGRVSVNGAVASIGDRVDAGSDLICLDGVPIPTRPWLVWYLVNKPSGVVCTSADPEGRPTVLDLVPSHPRVFSVGRLDADSEGLILLTNDGELANLVTHPSHGVEKEYLVEVRGNPKPSALRMLRQGVDLDDGRSAPAKVRVVAPGVLTLTLHEGRNRQVRRMCEAVGHPVLRLVRTRVGPISDPKLAPGSWRELTRKEIAALVDAARRGLSR